MAQQESMHRYVVQLESDIGRGLGVVVRDHILTCAHLFGVFKGTRGVMLSLKATIPEDGRTSEYFVQTLDCLLDFMVLGYSPIFQEIVGDLQIGLEEIEPHIIPQELVFPEGVDHVDIPVYFFLPDGKTPVHAEARISRHSPLIHVDAASLAGCSGGPVFTADHHLIGILLGGRKLEGQETEITHAVRIDLAATEWFRREVGGLQPLNLGRYVSAAAMNPERKNA